MCEEEIIKELESLSPSETAIIGILDLYNKEKENNKELKKANKKLQSDIEIKDKVIDLLIDDVYDNDNFWRLKCGFERIEKGKEKEYIKERFYKKVEEEKC